MSVFGPLARVQRLSLPAWGVGEPEPATRSLQDAKQGKRGSQLSRRGARARPGAGGGGREGRQPPSPSPERANLQPHLLGGKAARISRTRSVSMVLGAGWREGAPRSVNYRHPRPRGTERIEEKVIMEPTLEGEAWGGGCLRLNPLFSSLSDPRQDAVASKGRGRVEGGGRQMGGHSAPLCRRRRSPGSSR